MSALDPAAVAGDKLRAVSPNVVAYKLILKRVLDNRPSGMRQRLAKALGKNRSFISQMANPAYSTPAPAEHLEIIFELCHFSKAIRAARMSRARRRACARSRSPFPICTMPSAMRSSTVWSPISRITSNA
jgi:hypothetical protein